MEVLKNNIMPDKMLNNPELEYCPEMSHKIGANAYKHIKYEGFYVSAYDPVANKTWSGAITCLFTSGPNIAPCRQLIPKATAADATRLNRVITQIKASI